MWGRRREQIRRAHGPGDYVSGGAIAILAPEFVFASNLPLGRLHLLRKDAPMAFDVKWFGLVAASLVAAILIAWAG